MNWLVLFIAIFFEVLGTTFMKLSRGFSRPGPTTGMFIAYAIGLSLMNLVLRRMDVSIVYAVWSGVGTAMIAVIGFFWFKEPFTAIKIISILLIIFGVIGLNISTGRN